MSYGTQSWTARKYPSSNVAGLCRLDDDRDTRNLETAKMLYAQYLNPLTFRVHRKTRASFEDSRIQSIRTPAIRIVPSTQ